MTKRVVRSTRCANGGTVVLADDQIALPMAGHSPVFCFGRTFRDHHHVGDRADSGPMTPRPTLGSTRAQTAGQLPAQLTPALDIERLVDRFVTHLHHRIVRVFKAQAPGDLVERPELLKTLDDPCQEGRRGDHLGRLGPTGLLLRPNVAAPGAVSVATSIRPHFSADGGRCLVDPNGDSGERVALCQSDQDFLPVGNRQSPRTRRPGCWSRLPWRSVTGVRP